MYSQIPTHVANVNEFLSLDSSRGKLARKLYSISWAYEIHDITLTLMEACAFSAIFADGLSKFPVSL